MLQPSRARLDAKGQHREALPIYATLILFGVDLVVAAIFGILAVRSSPSRDEREALTINGLCMGLAVRWPWVLSSRLQALFFDLGATTLGRNLFGGGSDSAAPAYQRLGRTGLVNGRLRR
jgi:hypothetical protein